MGFVQHLYRVGYSLTCWISMGFLSRSPFTGVISRLTSARAGNRDLEIAPTEGYRDLEIAPTEKRLVRRTLAMGSL